MTENQGERAGWEEKLNRREKQESENLCFLHFDKYCENTCDTQIRLVFGLLLVKNSGENHVSIVGYYRRISDFWYRVPDTAPPISPGMPCRFSTPHVSCSPHEVKQYACRRAKPNTAVGWADKIKI